MRFFTWFCLLWVPSLYGDEGQPLKGAHAHNDYLHERPLLDALSHGFQSVEADIWLVDGELLVAHDRDKVKPGNTLQKLYLDPLKERYAKNQGNVYGGSYLPFFLLIDFKSEGESTYKAVDAALQDYRAMLTEFTESTTKRGAVTVVISGNRPRELMAKQPTRLAGYDGRLKDLTDTMNPHFMPWISDNWGQHFTWRGEGALSEKDQSKMTDILTRAHAAKVQVRFWAIPDNASLWGAMNDAKVDFINTDQLGELAAFLKKARSEQ